MNKTQLAISRNVKVQSCWKPLIDCLLDESKYTLEVFDSMNSEIVLQLVQNRKVHYFLLEVNNLDEQYACLDIWLQSSASAQKIVALVGSSNQGRHFQALLDVQLHLLDKATMVTVLPLMNIEYLRDHFDQIQTAAMSSRSGGSLVELPGPEAIVSLATTSEQSLLAHEIQKIRELCGSLEGLEKATRFESGRRQLQSILGSEKAQSLFTFWDDEWLAY